MFVIIVICGAVIAYLMFSGPRMRIQPNLRTYKFDMLSAPSGSIPLSRFTIDVNSLDDQKRIKPNAKSLETGKVFYNYYCAFCHGENGDGYGPVGYSYVPAVSNLRTAELKRYSDKQIYSKMVTGTGHSPMLTRIIPEDYGWYIVTYIKTLSDMNDQPERVSK